LAGVVVVVLALEEAVVVLAVYSTQRKSLFNEEFQFLHQLAEVVVVVQPPPTTVGVQGVQVLLQR
jgi:hypothetical protein